MFKNFREPLPGQQRGAAIDEIISWKNQPILWDTDSRIIIDVLQSVGILKRGLIYTAHELYVLFKNYKVDKPYAGCLVFWYIHALGEMRVTHVEMLIDNFFVIGASGKEGDTTHVKQNILTYRGNDFIIIDPFLDK